jgi:hypothetical protein
MHEWVFQRPQNSMSLKDKCYLRSLKNSQVINNLHKNVRGNCSFNLTFIANVPLAKFSWLGYINIYNANSLKIPLNYVSFVSLIIVLFKSKSFPLKKDKSHIFQPKWTFTLCSAAPCLFCFEAICDRYVFKLNCFKLIGWFYHQIVFPPIRSVCYRFLHCDYRKLHCDYR